MKTKSESTPNLEAEQHFGERLKQAREQMHLSAREVAQKMKISEHNILNIETGKVQGIPSVFFRDYVRNYGNLVGFPKEEIEVFLEQTQQKMKRKDVNYLLPEKKKQRGKRVWWFIILLILIIVGAIVGFDYYKKMNQENGVEVSYYIAEPPSDRSLGI